MKRWLSAAVSVAGAFTLLSTLNPAHAVDADALNGSREVTSSSASTVWEDRTLSISGRLTETTPTPDPDPTDGVTPESVTLGVSGASIGLWWRPAGGSWRQSTSRPTTAADGTWHGTLSWAAPGTVEVQARHGDWNGPTHLVNVRDRQVTHSQPQRRRVLVDRVVAQGKVVPAQSGVAVTVRYRFPKRPWRSRVVRSDSSGRWQFQTPVIRRTGALKVRVSTGSGATLETSTSGTTKIYPAFVAHDSPVTRASVRWTYRAGCPVGPGQLTAVRMTYRAYDGSYRWGTMVLAKTARAQIVGAFKRGFVSGFRIHHMSTNERYRGHDPTAMAANNTSAFNCRRVTGNPYALSPHSYGTAVDINTVQNPYQDSRGRWWPSRNKWVDRSRTHAGAIKAATPIRIAFAQAGWQWGGFWSNPDWQHFDPRGRFRPRATSGSPLTTLLPARVAGMKPSAEPADHAHATDHAHPTSASRLPAGAATAGARDPQQTLDALRYTCGAAQSPTGLVAAVGQGYADGERWGQALVIQLADASTTTATARWLASCSGVRTKGWSQRVQRVSATVLRLTATSTK